MERVKEKKVDQDQEQDERDKKKTSNLDGDYGNVAILLFLYLLQG
jgi:hypothetical protein